MDHFFNTTFLKSLPFLNFDAAADRTRPFTSACLGYSNISIAVPESDQTRPRWGIWGESACVGDRGEEAMGGRVSNSTHPLSIEMQPFCSRSISMFAVEFGKHHRGVQDFSRCGWFWLSEVPEVKESHRRLTFCRLYAPQECPGCVSSAHYRLFFAVDRGDQARVSSPEVSPSREPILESSKVDILANQASRPVYRKGVGFRV
jgi:hypothetical protein